jgi:hypothetical protein
MGCSISVEKVISNTDCVMLDISDIEKNVTTGDILLAHGGGFFSDLTEVVTRCPWSHSGVIIKEKNINNGDVLIWETTRIIEHYDIIKNKYQTGVSLALLRDKLYYYEGEYICIRKLCVPDYIREKFGCKLLKLIKEYDGREYDSNILDVAFTSFYTLPLINYNPHIKKSLFCSELVALTYGTLGLIDLSERRAIEYQPQDFSPCNNLNLPESCYFDKTMFVKLPHKKRSVKNRSTTIKLSDANDITVL